VPSATRVDGPSISAPAIGAVLSVLLMSGCAVFEHAAQREAPQVAAPSGATVSIAPQGVPFAPPPEPPQSTSMQRGTVAPEPSVPPAAPTASRSTGQGAAKPTAAVPKASAKIPSLSSPAAQLPKKETPTPAVAKPQAPPPLDLKALETRLKETAAIGVFTKLTLKNQIDDLLGRFRAFYQGHLQTTLVELRRSYDLMVLKVLALLQDADPPLAGAIAASREAIWSILSNPAKFSTV
jgi:hypothetical protein